MKSPAGVDTHSRVHVAAVVNAIGKILATASFAVTAAGYAELLGWMRSFGTLTAVGVEGTSSYGSGLCRFLVANNVAVIEVNRPNRPFAQRNIDRWPSSSERPHPNSTDLNGHDDHALFVVDWPN